jgi:hypothetical protein
MSVAAGGGNHRLNGTQIVDTGFVGATLYAAAASDQYNEVFASDDGGATWAPTRIASALSAGETVIGLTGDDTNRVLYAATTQGVLAFTPASAQWSVVAGATIAGRVSTIALGANVLFVGTDTGVFTIRRGSPPWSATATAAGLVGSSVRTVLVTGGNIYAGIIDSNDDNFVFYATEAEAAAGTAVWKPFATQSAGTNRITCLLLVGDRLLAATKGGLVRYATAGSTWSSANSNPDPTLQLSDAFGVINSLYSDGSLIFASTGSNGVFVSPSSGTSYAWTSYSGNGVTALPALEVNTLRANGGHIYASTRSGIATSAGSASPPVRAPEAVSGGGAFDPLLGLLCVAGIIAMRGKRQRH